MISRKESSVAGTETMSSSVCLAQYFSSDEFEKKRPSVCCVFSEDSHECIFACLAVSSVWGVFASLDTICRTGAANCLIL